MLGGGGGGSGVVLVSGNEVSQFFSNHRPQHRPYKATCRCEDWSLVMELHPSKRCIHQAKLDRLSCCLAILTN